MRAPARIAIAMVIATAIMLTLVSVAGANAPGSVVHRKSEACVPCHTLAPTHASWMRGSHRRMVCLDCHVDEGVIDHGQSKGKVTLAAKQLCHIGKAHGSVEPTVPAAAPAGKPTHPMMLCTRCHALTKTACAKCHTAKKGHPAGSCSLCHPVGSRWVFTHPASPRCASCHPAPQPHYTPRCTACHTIEVPFANARYDHTPGDTCATCHPAPAVHSTAVSCESCHTKSGSWDHQHPAGTDCVSCHPAPTTHYGANCTSCHAVTKPWKSATVAHPDVRGPHDYRSFACVQCHPGGNYHQTDCRSCHGREDD